MAPYDAVSGRSLGADFAVSAAAWYEELKSGPGWSRLLEQRGAQLAVIILLVALAIDSALILTRALSGLSASAPSSVPVRLAPPKPAVNPAVELANIVNAHLFGQAGAQAGGSAPQTTMPLILAGVIADKDPTKGQAIIGESTTAAKLVAVGAMIPGGVRLNSVYGDRVLIERNGRLETLMLPRSAVKNGAGNRPPPPPSAPQALAARDNSTLLAGMVRIQPVYVQNKLTGYHIFPGGTHGNSIFTQLGLRAGDLIVAINGTPLDDASRAMEVLQTLSSSASATVTVSRSGQTQEVNLNLANLNTDAETPAADNAAGTSGAEATGSPSSGQRPRGGLTGVPMTPPTGAGVPASTGQAPGDAAPPAPNGAAQQ
jgi:general secretion pathway protein C